ncbi:MAG: glycosyltransferase family 2 protein [Lachnospiraceae bacterium]|nr:glycosyltransferase family 2 protein [Lachnospiraceae bacterium]
MASISLCMIVKNEADVLARCLDSVADLVDEVVIVDTGSTDGTIDVAKTYTDRIFHFDWIDDFAAARNYAFAQCTKEYIYCADADEVLDEKNRERFRLLKEALDPAIDIVQMKYGNQLQFSTIYNYDEEYRPKMYKRLREFTWERPIHEAVRLTPLIYDSDVVITHLPKELHTSRDLAVFAKLAASGERLDRQLHNLYAKELFVSGSDEEFIAALRFFEESAEDVERSEDELLEAFCVAAAANRRRGDVTGFLKYALKAVGLGKSCSEICYELGEYFLGVGDYLEAQMWYYNAAFETESILNIHCGDDWPKKKLEECKHAILLSTDGGSDGESLS